MAVWLGSACASSAALPLEAEVSPAAAEALPAPVAEPAIEEAPLEQVAPGGEASPASPGLPIGARAPSFVLQDQVGREVALESLLEAGPVALVFFRSAGW